MTQQINRSNISKDGLKTTIHQNSQNSKLHKSSTDSLTDEEYLELKRLEDKYTKTPTTWEISQVFKDCRDIAREVRDNLISKTQYYKELIKIEPLMVHFMAINPKVIRINELQKFLNYTAPGNSKSQINIQKAKQVPIESLFDVEKKRRTSKRIQCSCPFHIDKTPSAMIYLESNIYHCYSCGVHLDSIAFKMKLSNLTFIQAVKNLQGEQE